MKEFKDLENPKKIPRRRLACAGFWSNEVRLLPPGVTEVSARWVRG